MRCFIAVDLSKDLINRVVDLQKQLNGDVKLVEPENLHFTLKFLGEVDVNTVVKAETILEGIAKATKPFDIRIAGAGVFPSEKFIRVVWLGAPELFNLQMSTETAFGGEEKPVPHLTIARARSHSEDTVNFLNKNRNVYIGEMKVDRIKLKKSTMLWNGPVYEDVRVFELEG